MFIRIHLTLAHVSSVVLTPVLPAPLECTCPHPSHAIIIIDPGCPFLPSFPSQSRTTTDSLPVTVNHVRLSPFPLALVNTCLPTPAPSQSRTLHLSLFL
ncbi:hypothetical protein Pcinc_042719 [Petrolisthes cinctipes]|uniref:Secreted protein n=1 Tax=Petrolisthes cinctipes TaxID=88211 RepID=A0AAE1BKL4_PETCI|nr:hypothetical protein Pcinc_042719 [Petrolisthes cinctipes]